MALKPKDILDTAVGVGKAAVGQVTRRFGGGDDAPETPTQASPPPPPSRSPEASTATSRAKPRRAPARSATSGAPRPGTAGGPKSGTAKKTTAAKKPAAAKKPTPAKKAAAPTPAAKTTTAAPKPAAAASKPAAPETPATAEKPAAAAAEARGGEEARRLRERLPGRRREAGRPRPRRSPSADGARGPPPGGPRASAAGPLRSGDASHPGPAHRRVPRAAARDQRARASPPRRVPDGVQRRRPVPARTRERPRTDAAVRLLCAFGRPGQGGPRDGRADRDRQALRARRRRRRPVHGDRRAGGLAAPPAAREAHDRQHLPRARDRRSACCPRSPPAPASRRWTSGARSPTSGERAGTTTTRSRSRAGATSC